MIPPFSRGVPPRIVAIHRYTRFLKQQKENFWQFAYKYCQNDASFLTELLVEREDRTIYATNEEIELLDTFVKELEQALEHVSRRRFIFLLGRVTVTSRFFYKQQIHFLEEGKQPLSIADLVQKMRTSYQRATVYANEFSPLPTFVKNMASFIVKQVLERLI